MNSPVLADAAHVLSDQLRDQLLRLGDNLRPVASRIERQFESRLRKLNFEPRQRQALQGITTGAAVKRLDAGRSIGAFFEEVEHHGRRLAKLNVAPSSILAAVAEFDRLVQDGLRRLPEAERDNQRWVADQLHFAVILTLNNAYYQVREGETEAFYRLSRVELESRSLDELLEGFLGAVLRACQADAGHLFLIEPGGKWVSRASSPSRKTLPAEVNHPTAPRRLLGQPRQFVPGKDAGVLDPGWAKRYRSCWSVPIASPDRVAGVLQLGFKRTSEWLPREMDLLLAAAERCLIASDKARLLEDLARREATIRELAEHMIHVEEAERRRISRELHDEAGQSMLCIRLALEMIEQSLPDALEATRIQVANTRDITEKTILEVRRLIAALSPAVLEQLGLGAALRQLVTRFRQMYPCKVKLQLSRTHAVPKKVQIIVYRILQECCNNIGKHAQADSVNISVSVADKRLRLRVEDNGSGFDLSQAQSKRNSFGLAGMRERVTLLGGEFAMESWPASSPRVSRNGRVETGTIVRVMIPIERRFGEDCEEGSTEERGSATRPPRARSTKVKPVSKEPGRKDRKGK